MYIENCTITPFELWLIKALQINNCTRNSNIGSGYYIIVLRKKKISLVTRFSDTKYDTELLLYVDVITIDVIARNSIWTKKNRVRHHFENIITYTCNSYFQHFHNNYTHSHKALTSIACPQYAPPP